MSFRTKWNGLKEVLAFDNSALLTFTKLFFPRERLHVYRYKGMQFLTDQDAGDANGAREVLTSSMYRDLLSDIELDGPVSVLDLGGNNGGFPLLLNALGMQVHKVVSVELNPKTFVRLHFNLNRNLQCEIHVINAAVCGMDGQMSVELGKGAVSDNIYERVFESDNHEFEINGYTFDTLYDRYFSNGAIDVCKMDIEGAEFEVLRGEACTQLRNCRYVIMEIHEREGRTAEELIAKLQNLGFAKQPTKVGADPTVHLFINDSIA